MAVPVSGAAVNPAVGFNLVIWGHFLEDHEIKHLWLYVIGPSLGGILAGLYHKGSYPSIFLRTSLQSN